MHLGDGLHSYQQLDFQLSLAMYQDASHFNFLTPPGVKNTILLLYLCLIKYSSVNLSCSSSNAYMGGWWYTENSGGLSSGPALSQQGSVCACIA